MNTPGEFSWGYLYNACEGLDCSNRVSNSQNLKENFQSERMEVCEIKKVTVCWYCNKEEHTKRNCLKRKKNLNKVNVREVESNEEYGAQDDCPNKINCQYLFFRAIGNFEAKEIKLKMIIGDKVIVGLVDTGSSVNLIKSKYIQGKKIEKCKEYLVSANGSEIKSLGKVKLSFRIETNTFEDDFVVSDDFTSDLILGYQFLKKEKVQINFGPIINISWGVKEDDDKLGKHRIFTTSEKPISGPNYRLGDEMEKEATKIIRKYIAEGVIRESSSPWRSPIVLVRKKMASLYYVLITGGLTQ